MLKILGTSHIAKQSVDEINEVMASFKPEIIAVELDIQRAMALMQKQTNKVSMADILKIGVKGYLFVKIGQFVQQKLGKMVGVAPGSDMKTAILLAKKNKLQLAFIDQPIQITLKNFSKSFTWREKGRFIADIFKGIFFKKKQIEIMGLQDFDLSKVPEKDLILKMMGQMKKRYPSIYKTLVEDRNKYMVKQLIKLLREHKEKNILAVVGAGHEEGMRKMLLKVDII